MASLQTTWESDPEAVTDDHGFLCPSAVLAIEAVHPFKARACDIRAHDLGSVPYEPGCFILYAGLLLEKSRFVHQT